jgi:hypothetical protein
MMGRFLDNLFGIERPPPECVIGKDGWWEYPDGRWWIESYNDSGGDNLQVLLHNREVMRKKGNNNA